MYLPESTRSKISLQTWGIAVECHCSNFGMHLSVVRRRTLPLVVLKCQRRNHLALAMPEDLKRGIIPVSGILKKYFDLVQLFAELFWFILKHEIIYLLFLIGHRNICIFCVTGSFLFIIIKYLLNTFQTNCSFVSCPSAVFSLHRSLYRWQWCRCTCLFGAAPNVWSGWMDAAILCSLHGYQVFSAFL